MKKGNFKYDYIIIDLTRPEIPQKQEAVESKMKNLT